MNLAILEMMHFDYGIWFYQSTAAAPSITNDLLHEHVARELQNPGLRLAIFPESHTEGKFRQPSLCESGPDSQTVVRSCRSENEALHHHLIRRSRAAGNNER